MSRCLVELLALDNFILLVSCLDALLLGELRVQDLLYALLLSKQS